MYIFIKNTLKIFFILISLNCFALDTNNTELIIDISQQRLYLKENNKITESFPISSSKYGEGSIVNLSLIHI